MVSLSAGARIAILTLRVFYVFWGKVIGTLAGLATTKPWFALVGLVIGHQFDRGFQARYSSMDDQMNSVGRLPDAYLRILFESMGHVAKCDGRVSEEEIRAARSVMHRLGLKPAQVRNAIRWFEDGKRRNYPLNARASELKRKYTGRRDLRQLFVRLLIEVSVAKTQVRPKERALVWSVCEALGVGRVELAQIEAMIRAQKGFRRSPQGDADRARLKQAYAELGVSPDADNDEIKRAYRRLTNRYHPDKLSASNPSLEEMKVAEQKTQRIRKAYEMLKARRSIR